MANISSIKVGNTSYGITATPTAHASTATTYGAASASNYGHVKLSDNYTSSAGTAASGIGASSAAVYNAYNTLNSNLASSISKITPDSIGAPVCARLHSTSSDTISSYYSSASSEYQFPITIPMYSVWWSSTAIVTISHTNDPSGAGPCGMDTFLCHSNKIVYPTTKRWESSVKLGNKSGSGGTNANSCYVDMLAGDATTIYVKIPTTGKWNYMNNISISVLFL